MDLKTSIANGNNQQPLLAWPYHVLFWAVYTLFWHVIYAPQLFSPEGLVTSGIFTIVHVLVSYWNIHWLLPKLWKRNRLAYLFLLIAGVIAGAVLLAGLLYLWIGRQSDIDPESFFSNVPYLMGSTLGSTFSAVMFTMGLYLLGQRKRLEQRQQQLEEARTKAELQFLRQQLDPHFLFNVLNNIYFLIKKNPDQAADALAGFSDLLRYQIYQTKTDFIPLHEEFDYLKQYARLASLRLPNEAKVQVVLQNDLSDQWQVPPLLLLPLIENAFKHVNKDQAKIEIEGKVIDGTLHFRVFNSKGVVVPKTDNQQQPEKGIGLDNLQQRLMLLYTNKHQLTYDETPVYYQVDLKLDVA